MVVPDTHLHLDMIGEETRDVVSRAFLAGVSPLISIGISVESSRETLRLSEEFREVYAVVGIHPNDTGEADGESYAEIRRIALSSSKVVGIGETGLDYYRNSSPREKQEESFRAHINLAKELGKALVVHCRDAHDDVLRILAEEGSSKVIMHCFSGNVETLKLCAERGYFISFAGPLTFRNAEKLREVASFAPAELILVETDSPFLSPEPYRGKKNYPERARLVAEELARIRKISIDEMEEILKMNARNAFAVK